MFEDWLSELESEMHNSYFLNSNKKYNDNLSIRTEYTRWK